MIPNFAAPLFAQAVAQLLTDPESGSLAFIRCLPAAAVRELAADPRFELPPWRVAAVVERADPESRAITADTAVEWREDKAEPVLLLIDPQAAGAGMDGIYSAAREIGETELFQQVIKSAEQQLPASHRPYVEQAQRKARQLSGHRPLSPWQRLRYFGQLLEDPQQIGSALYHLGLWPIDTRSGLEMADLDRAARLTERLLPTQGRRSSAEQRVAALQLDPAQSAVGQQLAQTLRRLESRPQPDRLAQIAATPDFWLNRLRPGLFDEQQLHTIQWIPWRGKQGQLLTWSGLKEVGKELPVLAIPLEESSTERVRLEVRWTTEPSGLAPGVVDYRVEIRAGEECLAEKGCSQSGKQPQKIVFTHEDFEALSESAQFEAQVVIHSLGHTPCKAESTIFLLCLGGESAESHERVSSSSGTTFPNLALAAAHVAPNLEAFKQLIENPRNPNFFGRDAKGFITCRYEGKIGKVFCPPLFNQLAEDWIAQQGALGHWRITVRTDGTAASEPEFVPLHLESDEANRMRAASQQMAQWLKGTQGPLGVIYDGFKVGNEYILAAGESWKQGDPALTRIQTLEVLSVSGRSLGLIVLPSHPLRVAWQQSFDLLVMYHRYAQKLSVNRIKALLEPVTGAYYPAFLPGFTPEQTFIFADTLGFHAIGMVPVNDPEPKATIALLGRLLMGEDQNSAPTVGQGIANALAKEVGHYRQLHPAYRQLQIHALRAGDGMTVARALGMTLQEAVEPEASDVALNELPLSYRLDLYPAEGEVTLVTGRFLTLTAARRRTGAGAVPEPDRWLLESVTRPGGVTLPRLRWARRSQAVPQSPAHLAFGFDLFTSRVEYRPRKELTKAGVLEAHGLMLMLNREFNATEQPYWMSYIPPELAGELHPFTEKLTHRQIRLHRQLLSATARSLGGTAEDWPVLLTEVPPKQAAVMAQIHRCCDWVITADRNAGIEYFDSPQTLPGIYHAYIIDSVPERDDLGFLQIITSTSSFEEVLTLLSETLKQMGLAATPENGRLLLDALRAVSGRMVLRLVGVGAVAAQEMIAIALVYHQCVRAVAGDPIWLPLSHGFLVSLDEIPDLFPHPQREHAESRQRADLLYVSFRPEGGLALAFVEVKFRHDLKSARAPELLEKIEQQIESSCQQWHTALGKQATVLEQTIHRARLARVLRFYARKGHRYHLTQSAYDKLMQNLDRLVRKEIDLPEFAEFRRIGLIFCPEYSAEQPTRLETGRLASIWLFGSHTIPPSVRLPQPAEPMIPAPLRPTAPQPASVERALPPSSSMPKRPHLSPVEIALPVRDPLSMEGESPPAPPSPEIAPPPPEPCLILGHRPPPSSLEVIWKPVIHANPHLMILGLPGMGKTTCILNLADQLQAQGITPIIFSYHQDIDEKLIARSEGAYQAISYSGLGFNPLEVDHTSPLAYLDNIGMIRDIFAAIFPDLGDVQLGRLREALKNSYLEQGWGSGQRGTTPLFRTFFDQLKGELKPDKGLLTRLSELADYGLFDQVTGAASLLDQRKPSLIQIHTTQNEALQRAFATFVLYNLYQQMFRRGTQTQITHAIIFDEAHRAAKLKLLPTMVKECRKYGLAFVVASQEAKDFDSSLFTAVANYLVLRLNESDARHMARTIAASERIATYTDTIKQMAKHRALYYGEGQRDPVLTQLTDY